MMFGNFKEKLVNVQHDISTGFKNLSVRAREVGRPKRKYGTNDSFSLRNVSKDFNLDAGADLLNRFQVSWIEIHRDIEETGQRASLVDSQIFGVVEKFEKSSKMVKEFGDNLDELSKLQKNLTSLASQLGKLEGDFEEIETMLICLEDLCEKEELAKKMEQSRIQLKTLEEAKKLEQEKLIVNLEMEYAKTVKEMETSEEAKMKERQKAFQEVFDMDMARYKQVGHTEGPITNSGHATPKPSVSSLDEMDLEDVMDQTALNKFLEDSQEFPERGEEEVLQQQEAEESGEDDEPSGYVELEENEIEMEPDGDLPPQLPDGEEGREEDDTGCHGDDDPGCHGDGKPVGEGDEIFDVASETVKLTQEAESVQKA